MVNASSAITIIPGACPHDCPDRCAWLVTVEGDRAVNLAGDPSHPFTRGGLCAKVNHYLERVYSPDRLLHPLRRTGPKGAGEFERVSWDEALEDITARLKQVVATDGPTAVMPYSYSGTQGMIQSDAMSGRFSAAWAPRAWNVQSAAAPDPLVSRRRWAPRWGCCPRT